jgi:hypothetical protein
MNWYGNRRDPRQTSFEFDHHNRFDEFDPDYLRRLPLWMPARWNRPPYYSGWDSNRPYWGKPVYPWKPWYRRGRWRSDAEVFNDRLKLVAITVVVMPVILVELAVLLSYLRQ